MKLRTPWIVTGSLATLAAAGGLGAALAGPPADRELTTGVVSQLPSPSATGDVAPTTDVASPGTSALTPATSSPATSSAASPVAVSALSPVVVSAPSPAPARAPAPVSAGSPVSADSGWSAESADSGD